MLETSPKGDMIIEVRGSTLTQLAQRLSGRVDRNVLDKTGIAGRFNFRLEFTPDPHMPGQAIPAANAGTAADPGPDLFIALQEQIGLKLSPDRGPVSYLIIDYAEKATAN